MAASVVPALKVAGAFLAGPTGTALTTGLAAVSTIMSVQAANAEAAAQAAAAKAQAKIAEDNALQARMGAQSDAQDADLEAAQILASIEARNGATGFLLSSPGFVRREQRNRLNSRVTRERIIEDGERQAESSLNQAESFRSRVASAKDTSRYTRLAGFIQVGTDLVSGAALTADRRAKINERNRVNVGT